MKNTILALTLAFSACSLAEPNQVKPNQIEQREMMEKAMALGSITELNTLSPNTEKQLQLRLFKIPSMAKHDCFVETHGVCHFNYFISVTTFDEYPESNVYLLKIQGEITDIQWKATKKVDFAELELTVSNYSKLALKNNANLKGAVTKVSTYITPHSIEETH